PGEPGHLPSFPTRRSSDLLHLQVTAPGKAQIRDQRRCNGPQPQQRSQQQPKRVAEGLGRIEAGWAKRLQIGLEIGDRGQLEDLEDRKSTRLNSSHVKISYA